MMGASRPLLPLLLAEVPASLRVALEQDGVPMRDFREAPQDGRFVLYDSRRAPRPQITSDQRAIDVDAIRKTLDRDCFAELADPTTCRSVWRVGSWDAVEETAAIDRAAVRATVVGELRRTIEGLGGVWLRVAAAPYPYRTTFSFRFDHDAYVPGDFAAVMQAVAGHEDATTHFICAETHESHAAALRRLDGCDVGSHGYRHHTYRTRAENVRNILRGIEALRSLGFAPSGFAAPHGRHGPCVADAMRACGITHSSEFAAAYDDEPYFDAAAEAWQIPIHPVCLGIALEAVDRLAANDAAARDRAAAEVADYFPTVADARRAAGRPIMLYGHPDGRLGRYPHVVRNVLEHVAGWSDVWRTNYTTIRTWQAARRAVRMTAYEIEQGYEVHADRLPTAFDCGLEWIRSDARTTLPLSSPQLKLARISSTWEPLPRVDVPRPVRREPICGLRERLRRALDWEYVTPVGEIDARPWRGRLKRTLRHWKGRAA